MIYLDTHVVVWLYDGQLGKIPKKTRLLLEKNDLAISPMVELELEYLFESRRVTERAQTYTLDLQKRIGLQTCDEAFQDVIRQALAEKWTRDPFDRIITAHARMKNVPLLTADRTIRKNYSRALWG